MFDVLVWAEFGLIALVVLLVVGPQDLPKVLRFVGRCIGKMRELSFKLHNYATLLEHYPEETSLKEKPLKDRSLKDKSFSEKKK